MPPTGAETGLIKAIISAFIKPFEIVVTPVAERVASWLKRKPRLHVHFHPLVCMWCLANENVDPVMQLVMTADFTHDGPTEDLIIVDAYPVGSKSWHPFEKFDIPTHHLIEEHPAIFAHPVVGQKGKDWTGRIIFVDQFGRKYKSPKHTFKWAGPQQSKPSSS